MTGQALSCTGKLASTPYRFDKVFVNLYSIEELCYVIYENAFLIDNDIVNKELTDWIYTECGLPELALSLYSLINNNGQAGAFVGTILDYVGYYSKDEIEKVESILKMNVSMSIYEKWKAKADFLFENRHYNLALKEYARVLSELPEDNTELRSRIYNNMGVTNMAMYLTDKAAECFKKAYETDGSETAYKHYLTVMRISLPEEEYIKLVADDELAYKLSIGLESEFEEVKAEYEDSDEAKRMKDLFLLKDSSNAALYYEQIGRMTERLKEDYRDAVLEGSDPGE